MPGWLTVEVILLATVVLLGILIVISLWTLALLNQMLGRILSALDIYDGGLRNSETLGAISRTLKRIERGWNQDWS